MSKHYYFGACVFAIVFVYIIEALGADVKTLLLVGLAFLFSLMGAILNELYEHRTTSGQFERNVRSRLEETSFELQILRDCKFNELQSRTCGLMQTLEALGKLADSMKQVSPKETADAQPENEPQVNVTPHLKNVKR